MLPLTDTGAARGGLSPYHSNVCGRQGSRSQPSDRSVTIVLAQQLDRGARSIVAESDILLRWRRRVAQPARRAFIVRTLPPLSTSVHLLLMSALSLKADIPQHPDDVCFVPIPDVSAPHFPKDVAGWLQDCCPKGSRLSLARVTLAIA